MATINNNYKKENETAKINFFNVTKYKEHYNDN